MYCLFCSGFAGTLPKGPAIRRSPTKGLYRFTGVVQVKCSDPTYRFRGVGVWSLGIRT